MGKAVDKVEKEEEEQFDVCEFTKRHLRVDSWVNERAQVYTAKELHELVNQVILIFKKEPTLALMSPPCTIVGDIHGQYVDLVRILNSWTEHNSTDKKEYDLGCCKKRFVFLGDFVDRGSFSVECISLVFGLKILYPNQYALIRGNHETKSVNFAYGFREELVNKMGPKEGTEVWEHFNEAFAWMPLAGLVGGRILCMHGGISPFLNSLDDIRQIKRPLMEVTGNPLALDLLWSDPIQIFNIYSMNDEPQFLKNANRGLSCTFNGPAVRECVKKLNVQLIVRAHQVQDGGFSFSADRKLITVFSAPNYLNENNNRAAVLKVKKDGLINIRAFRSHTKKREGPMKPEITKGASESVKKEQTTQAPSRKSVNPKSNPK